MVQEAELPERRDKALQVVNRKGFVSIGELVELLGVSESTARRDLEALEAQGVVRRTHGGVISLAEPPATRLAFSDRTATAVEEKTAIAAAVAAMIEDNQTVILNGGTTCCCLAEALRGRRLSIVTNSVPIAALLGGEIHTEITMIGGYLYPRTGVTLGTAAVDMLGTLRAARAVMSCAAVNPDGAFNVNEMMTAVEQRMIEVADEVILAVDHTKFGKRAIARLCGWGDVSVVVTDAGIDAESLGWLERMDVRVVVAEEKA
ncbi:MAG TPA: DeoR/GlpR family DNA-binding transcription regulator [Phycisphaerae bacterium]|nr:DeoR/GlpR family DNA-binding transcription regulator [Phycisphaerae bacterium]